jgi:hypothetical protein
MDAMVLAVVTVLLVYFVVALLFEWAYEGFVRRRILSRVREAGGELIRLERIRESSGLRTLGSSVQDGSSRLRYLVRYRTKKGEELTRLCILSSSGSVVWYDERQ